MRLTIVLLNLLNLCTLPFRPRQAAHNWASPFNHTEQPSEATLSLIANSISSSHPSINSITISILPPVFFRSISTFDNQTILERAETVVGGFLEGWTQRVGDPVISKWIVIILCVSMGLNAWLLNAAGRGAMQSINVPAAKPALEIKDKVEKSNPTIAVSDTNTVARANVFSLNDSESDDDEKHVHAIKRSTRRVRSVTECMQILTEGRPQDLLDEEIIALTLQKKIPLYALEKTLQDLERAVKIRRATVCNARHHPLLMPSSRVNHNDVRVLRTPLQAIRLQPRHGSMLRKCNRLYPTSSRRSRSLYHRRRGILATNGHHRRLSRRQYHARLQSHERRRRSLHDSASRRHDPWSMCSISNCHESRPSETMAR